MVHSEMRTLQRQNELLKNEVHLLKLSNKTHLRNVDTSMRRLASFPASRGYRRSNNVAMNNELPNAGAVGDANAGVGTNQHSNTPQPPLIGTVLTKTPKALHTLWLEWEFGIGGNKPAKDFTAIERGQVRFQYSLRKVFWDLCSQMIRRGYSSDAAIDKIYSVYPRLSLTQILRKI